MEHLPHTMTGGGHIIRTLVFGLISNAFDVGSDLLNAFQYYRYFFALVVQGLGKFWMIPIDQLWSQGSNSEEDPADEQLLVDEWVGGGGGDRALRRFQGGSASNKWQVGQNGTKSL